ncbi:MAG: TorF family putative porin [Pseudomonadota bacterium]
MTSRFKLLSLAAIMGLGVAGTGAAQQGEFSGNITLTTDYVFRGVTQTDGAPMVQGGFDWASDTFYVGTWASGVDFGDGTSTEIDIYAGFTPTVGIFSLDLGAIYYLYPDAPDNPDQNFIEFYAGGSTTLGDILDVGASVAFSPDFYLETGQALYISGSAGIPLGENFGLDGTVGFSEFLDSDDCPGCDYADFSIGLTTSAAGFDFDARFIDTIDLNGNDESFVVSVSRSL